MSWVQLASWTHDNNGFFYSRYPEPENKLESVNEHQKLYFHRMGTPQDQDRLIFENPENPKMGYGGYVNEKGTTLYIYGWQGTDDRNTLYSLDLTNPDSAVVKLFDAMDASIASKSLTTAESGLVRSSE